MTDRPDGNDDLPLQGLLEQTMSGGASDGDLGLPEAPPAAPPIDLQGNTPPTAPTITPPGSEPPAAAEAAPTPQAAREAGARQGDGAEAGPAPEPKRVKMRVRPHREDWQTKPSDRFVLRFIKENISAHITPGLAGGPLSPTMITLVSAALGIGAGVLFGLGWGWIGALAAALAQILDGVDGQLARYTGQESAAGAFWDSTLDRYADGALVIGLVVYLARLPDFPVPPWIVVVLGAMAIIGCNLISYTTARAESLGLDIGPPTLASKGTRTTVVVICGLVSVVLPQLPLAALVYLALHPSAEVLQRLARAGNEEAPHVVHTARRDPRAVPGAARRSPQLPPRRKIEMPASARRGDQSGSPADRRGPGGPGSQQH